MFASRYFVSNCAKRVNVTRSGLALPLAAGLICIHTWKTGLQQGSPAPSFLSLFPSCILARKSALVKKKTTKKPTPHHANLGQIIPHHAHVLFHRLFFFWKIVLRSRKVSSSAPPSSGTACHIGRREPCSRRRNLFSPSPGFRNTRRKHLALALIYAETLANLFYVITNSCF